MQLPPRDPNREVVIETEKGTAAPARAVTEIESPARIAVMRVGSTRSSTVSVSRASSDGCTMRATHEEPRGPLAIVGRKRARRPSSLEAFT